MLNLISILLISGAVLLTFPVVIFLVEIVAAVAMPSRPSAASSTQLRPRLAVLVPAHNEGKGVLATVADVKRQLRIGDRLLVVADNCTDDTAAVAAGAGAEVIERHDPNQVGKGYALAWGVGHLGLDPPGIVIFIDADCRVADDALDRLASACVATNRPVQALFLMTATDDAPINTKVAEFAWYLKNYVRPRGLYNLGLPCQLMGSGMAFPWNVIGVVNLASASIVEDLKLGLDLALAGHPPVFRPSPGVVSEFPQTLRGLQSQRQRWEHGHIGTIVTAWPHLISVAIIRRDLNLLALAFDLIVPPLSLLGLLVVAMSVVDALATSLFGISPTAMLIASANLVGLIIAGFISWLKFGRTILPPRSMILVFPYVFRKLALYAKILPGKSGPRWTRTERTKF